MAIVLEFHQVARVPVGRAFAYVTDVGRNPEWDEFVCSEHNQYVTIATETYAISDDNLLMPTRKGQPAPDLRYFPNRK